MNKIISLITLFCLLCCLVACMHDPYQGKRPSDYEDARWACSSPDVYFDIHYSKSAYDIQSIVGLLKYDKQDTKILLVFDEDADGVWFMDDDSNLIFYGTCKFSPEKMVVKINPKKDYFFDGKVDELVFVRTELPSDANIIE